MNIEPTYWNEGGLKLNLATIGDADTQGLLQRANLVVVDISARNGHWREYFWIGSAPSPSGRQRITAIRIYRVLLDPDGRILGRNLIWEQIDKRFSKKDLTFDLLDFGETNPVYWYGKRVHVASIEEGGVKASKLEQDMKPNKATKKK